MCSARERGRTEQRRTWAYMISGQSAVLLIFDNPTTTRRVTDARRVLLLEIMLMNAGRIVVICLLTACGRNARLAGHGVLAATADTLASRVKNWSCDRSITQPARGKLTYCLGERGDTVFYYALDTLKEVVLVATQNGVDANDTIATPQAGIGDTTQWQPCTNQVDAIAQMWRKDPRGYEIAININPGQGTRANRIRRHVVTALAPPCAETYPPPLQQ